MSTKTESPIANVVEGIEGQNVGEAVDVAAPQRVITVPGLDPIVVGEKLPTDVLTSDFSLALRVKADVQAQYEIAKVAEADAALLAQTRKEYMDEIKLEIISDLVDGGLAATRAEKEYKKDQRWVMAQNLKALADSQRKDAECAHSILSQRHFAIQQVMNALYGIRTA